VWVVPGRGSWRGEVVVMNAQARQRGAGVCAQVLLYARCCFTEPLLLFAVRAPVMPFMLPC